MKKDLGIYIHIPFCERKCNYCSFLSFEFDEKKVERYIEQLLIEIKYTSEIYKKDYIVNSVFIGGGTPSILKEHHVQKILETLKKNYFLIENAEITIESNPNSLDESKLENYKQNGINRLSIGVQSFDDNLLKILGRTHTSKDVVYAYKLARKVGFKNINLDIMFGVPEQSETSWGKTINRVLELSPEHISLYSLQIEKNTIFYKKYKDEELNFIGDKKVNKMYIEAIKTLEEKGYKHYEISNCAKVERQCIHNIKYWTMKEYIGFGAGAYSYVNKKEFKNSDDLYNWNSKVSERSVREEMGTFIFTGLRMRSGIDLKVFEKNFQISFYDAYNDKINFLREEEKKGNVVLSDDKLLLTTKGILVSNDLMCEFV